jgi:hypothetical protein
MNNTGASMREDCKSKCSSQVPDAAKYTLELVGASYPGYAAQHVSEMDGPIYFPTCHPWGGRDEIREFAVNGIRFHLPRPTPVTTGDQPFLRIESISLDGIPIGLE